MENKFNSENMKYYAYSAEVPKDAQKEFSNGTFSGTDINPMWRIRTLTEMFGPAGIGWYTEILSERQEQITEDHTICIIDLNLYVKVDGEWSKPIFGTGGNTLKTKTSKGYIKSTDEGYKMAYTDALGVACKALGIGAKVYWNKDRTKYDDYLKNEDDDIPPTTRPMKPTPPPSHEEPHKKSSTQPITAVVDFEANPEAVSQEELSRICDYVRAMGGEEKKNDVDLTKLIKSENNGKANYRKVDDENTRLMIYKAVYEKYIQEDK